MTTRPITEAGGGPAALAAAEEFPRRDRKAYRVLIMEADPALHALLAEWLAGFGCTVEAHDAAPAGREVPFDLVIVDVPFPRESGRAVIERTRGDHAGVPILVLSSRFFGGVRSRGAIARDLEVAGVLPKPLTRETLIEALEQVLR